VAVEENYSAADALKQENRMLQISRAREDSPAQGRQIIVDRTRLLGDHSEREPPDPIPNSEVKPLSADDSVAGCHAKVGNRQALYLKNPSLIRLGFFFD
jgi:hypothetical protein